MEEVSIQGLNEHYFMLAKNTRRLEQGNKVELDTAPIKLLSPFDNILRERAFPKRIWDFDYKIECYVPKPDRVYGYFVLPILDKTELAGRADVKAHRKDRVLEIVSLYIENDALRTDDGFERLQKGIEDFASFHNCESIKLGKVIPRKLTKKIRLRLSK